MTQFFATVDMFNLCEGTFWILCAVGVYLYTFYTSRVFLPWLKFSSLNLFLFGITDYVEMYTGGFLHTSHWLLYWKITHVTGLIISVGWYLFLRLKR